MAFDPTNWRAQFRTPPFIPPGVFTEREQQQEGEQAQPTQQWTPPAPVSMGEFSPNNTPAPKTSPYFGDVNTSTRRAPLHQGNIDLTKQKVVKNADGTTSTVRSMSFERDGREILIPTTAHDGSRILSDDEAIAQYDASGRHLGIFDTPDNATAYARQLSADYAAGKIQGYPATGKSLFPAPVSAGDFSYDETPAQMAAAPRGEQSPTSTTSRPPLSDEAAKRYEEMLRTKPKRSWLGTVGALASGAAAGYLNATGKFNQRFGMDPEAQREMAFPGHAEGLKRAQMAAQLEHQKNQEALSQQQRDTQNRYYEGLIENQQQANQDRAAARTGAETARLAKIAEDAKKTKIEAADWAAKRIEAGGTVYTPPPPVTLSPSMYSNQERGSIPPTVQSVSENLPAMPTTRSSIPPAFTVQEPEPDNLIEDPYSGKKFAPKSKLVVIPKIISDALKIPDGTEIPTTELDSYVKIYEAQMKNPDLVFSNLTNDRTGDVTVIGRNKKTGEEKFRQVIPGVAEKRPPTADHGVTMIGGDGKVYRLQPGQDVPDGARTASGVNAENTLTSTTRSMVEVAPKVVGFVDRINQLIDRQQKNLGPASSRWRDFWSGKVGANDPEFRRLNADIGLLTTALMRMHVGARGGTQMLEHFKDLINHSRQDPENLRASLDEIKQYAISMQNMKATGGDSGKDGPPLAKVETVPYTDQGKDYDIPVDEVDAFVKARPNAKRR